MSGHSVPQPLTPAPPAPSDGARLGADTVVSGSELLEHIERLSAELAVTRAQLRFAEGRAAAYLKERSARRQAAGELKRLRDVERQRDHVTEANEQLVKQLEAMWVQMQAAEARLAEAHRSGRFARLRDLRA
jgi:hypothetical protein